MFLKSLTRLGQSPIKRRCAVAHSMFVCRVGDLLCCRVRVRGTC